MIPEYVVTFKGHFMISINQFHIQHISPLVSNFVNDKYDGIGWFSYAVHCALCSGCRSFLIFTYVYFLIFLTPCVKLLFPWCKCDIPDWLGYKNASDTEEINP